MDMFVPGEGFDARGAPIWAIVLAGGRGTRLRTLTADRTGVAVPKQFCSLRGGCSLLREALCRARAVAPRERVCAVVARQHGQWWSRELVDLPDDNVIVQPANRGTAIGILLPSLLIAARDPRATVVVLPSDHHADDEATLAIALRSAARIAAHDPRHLVLLGIAPDEADPELGYVVPGSEAGDGSCTVARFVEKPAPSLAADLLRAGALWNSFLFAARARTLLGLFEQRIGEVVDGMRDALERDRRPGANGRALAGFYAGLRETDFSREIVRGSEDALRVLAVPACGWSDLGTPQRLAATLRRLPPAAEGIFDRDAPCPGVLNLAAQQARLLAAGP